MQPIKVPNFMKFQIGKFRYGISAKKGLQKIIIVLY